MMVCVRSCTYQANHMKHLSFIHSFQLFLICTVAIGDTVYFPLSVSQLSTSDSSEHGVSSMMGATEKPCELAQVT